MSLEKAYNIYNQFKSVEIQMAYIRKMYEDTKALELNKLTADNPGFVEAAYELLDFVKDFVKEIEESDTNLDPETTKLEGVDNLFEGHHATEFVNMALNEVYNSQGVPANALNEGVDKPCCDECTDPCPCKAITKHSYRYEGYCWCGFLKKLHKEGKSIATCNISKEILHSIEAMRDPDGNCVCSKDNDRLSEFKCADKHDCRYPLCTCSIGK